MEIVNFILLLILLFSLFSLKNRVTEMQEKLNGFIKSSAIKNQSSKLPDAVTEKPKPTVVVADHKIEEKPKPVAVASSSKNVTNPKPKEPAIKQQEAYRSVASKQKKPSFMERNPDLEKFIGENLLSKIGIVIFVIGMGFLVKLGIDNNVITEPLRVAIGVFIGGVMISIAHYLRKTFAKFSSILIGGALAVLYFTIALAFHEYQLFTQTIAFVIMVFITVFAVLLSVGYNRKELAVLAVLGGFGTPFFISTGSGNVTVLFSYLLLLNVGMLSLVYFKKWNVINYICYSLTYILFVGVYSSKFIGNEAQLRPTMLLFLMLFYLVFFAMNLIYNIKNKRKFQVSEILMFLSNTGIFFGFGLAIITGYKDGLLNGLFTALVAIFNCLFALLLFKRKDIDKNLIYLLIGVVLTFVSLIAPIQLNGNNITLFWAAESVLLLWLAKKSNIQFIKLSSVIVMILMLLSLLMDWQQNYSVWSAEILPIIINKTFITTVVALLALLGNIKMLQKIEYIALWSIEFVWKQIWVKIIATMVLYLGLLLEFNYQLRLLNLSTSYWQLLIAIYHFIWVFTLLQIERYKPIKGLFTLNIFLSSAAILAYGTFLESIIGSARNLLISTKHVLSGFYSHYVLLLLLVLIVVHFYRKLYAKYGFRSQEGKIALWSLSVIGVIIASLEIGHVAIIIEHASNTNLAALQKSVVRSVYPVVWGVTAFALMILGMRFKLKTLRIISLVLFCITILKLFLFDLAGNATGKIISFIVLGIILLVISFLYQKLKFIIQDDEAVEKS